MTTELTAAVAAFKYAESNDTNADSENAVTVKTADIADGVNSFTSTRRFIAGAICPQCQRLDKIVVYSLNDVKMAECVSCGFLQQDPTANSSDNIK